MGVKLERTRDARVFGTQKRVKEFESKVKKEINGTITKSLFRVIKIH